MKAVVYARIIGHTCTWHVSLDIRADLVHWFGEYSNPLRIWMLEPAFSFGQALLLTKKLNDMKWKAEQVSKPNLLLEVVSGQAELLGIPFGGRDKLGAHLRECDWQQWESYRTTQAGSRTTRQEELKKFISVMQGRSLFLEEVSQLMEHHGLLDAVEQPLIYIQTGYLLGELQINPGVHMGSKRTFPTLRSGPVYTCQRCGSGTKHMVMTDCLFCGASCPYCENCLTMGRSRYCSVMVCATGRTHSSANFNDRAASFNITDYETDAESKEHNDRYISPWGLSTVQAEAAYLALQFLKANEFQIKHSKSKSMNAENSKAKHNDKP